MMLPFAATSERAKERWNLQFLHRHAAAAAAAEENDSICPSEERGCVWENRKSGNEGGMRPNRATRNQTHLFGIGARSSRAVLDSSLLLVVGNGATQMASNFSKAARTARGVCAAPQLLNAPHISGALQATSKVLHRSLSLSLPLSPPFLFRPLCKLCGCGMTPFLSSSPPVLLIPCLPHGRSFVRVGGSWQRTLMFF